MSVRHKEITTYEEFAARLYSPVPINTPTIGHVGHTAAALLDSQRIKQTSNKSESPFHFSHTSDIRDFSQFKKKRRSPLVIH